MVLVEPGVCPASYTEPQIAKLAMVPLLIVYGDHLGDTPTGIPGNSSNSGPNLTLTTDRASRPLIFPSSHPTLLLPAGQSACRLSRSILN